MRRPYTQALSRAAHKPLEEMSARNIVAVAVAVGVGVASGRAFATIIPDQISRMRH